MRRLVKRLLKKYDYPPEGREDALQIVMSQCEMWADNERNMDSVFEEEANTYGIKTEHTLQMVAEESAPYGKKEAEFLF